MNVSCLSVWFETSKPLLDVSECCPVELWVYDVLCDRVSACVVRFEDLEVCRLVTCCSTLTKIGDLSFELTISDPSLG